MPIIGYKSNTMIQTIPSSDYSIEIGPLQNSSFEELLNTKYGNSRKIILVDENTHDACLEFLITSFTALEDAEVMLLPCGEENKVMEVCFQVWEAWSEYEIERTDLVINLGGGMVCDMGGFMASLFKRGLDFIHIPTSLLAMVDASIGGKTGIDLGKYKNQLGVFSNPKNVYVDPGFLTTLPVDELKNGLAEMLKHGLIASQNHWNEIKFIDPTEDVFSTKVIFDSVAIKNGIVLADPLEREARKKLNFGHTFGHAIEGLFLHEEFQIAHGHAVATGILAEAYISWKRKLIEDAAFAEIEKTIIALFEIPLLDLEAALPLFQLMQNDKKNFNRAVQCTLLTNIGESIVNQVIELEDIVAVLVFFQKYSK